MSWKVKLSLVAVATSISSMSSLANEKQKTEPLSLELLEFLGDFSDEEGQVLDPETMELVAVADCKTKLSSPTPTQNKPENNKNENERQLNGKTLTQPTDKQCQTAEQQKPKQELTDDAKI